MYNPIRLCVFMILHTEGLFNIVFGDARTAFDPKEYKKFLPGESLLSCSPFSSLQKSMHLEQLVFLHQIHSTEGTAIVSHDQASKIPPFRYDGDFLMTNVPMVGLAIATADCLPIILYSPFCNVIALVHAGWRGSTNGIVFNVVRQMTQVFGIKPKDLRVFFGPHARSCCYEVGHDVLNTLDAFCYKEDVIHRIAGKTYLDLLLFNQLLLQEMGVLKQSFSKSYALCTMCNASFCSYRRQQNANRQMTVVTLK